VVYVSQNPMHTHKWCVGGKVEGA